MPRSIPTAFLFPILSLFSLLITPSCCQPIWFESDSLLGRHWHIWQQGKFLLPSSCSGKSSAPQLSTLIGWNILETRSHWWSTLFWKDLPTLVQSVIWETNVLFWNNPGQSMEIHGKEEKERGCFFNVMNLIFFMK